MSASQRSMLMARADLASARGADSIDAADHIEAEPAEQVVSQITQRSMQANSALMRGDSKRYFELVAITDDFTLMSPFGGPPSRAFEYTANRVEAMGRFFKNGTFRQELGPGLRERGHGGPSDHRTAARRGGKSASTGLGVARHPRLSATRIPLAAGSSACRPTGRRRQRGRGGRPRSRRRGIA
jgi:hypothetical protein